MERPALVRWAPLAFALLFVAGLLLRAGTSALDLIRYALYGGLAVILPGTLVYRALRRRAHTLVEDLALGAAIGLCLEIAAWAVFSALDLRGVTWVWPALVVVPFLAVPRLRRHWRVTGYEPTPLGWSWCVAAVVCFFTAYLSMVFIDRNPILPPSDGTLQYLDLAYQLSLAGDAKNHIPVGLPQVAGEPLYYHWFAYVHAAMTSMVGHIDLPVVMLRLAIPALCALAVVLTGVVGWRVSGKPYAGAAAAALFFAVGEFSFINPVTFPFGTQATFVVWHGMSMIYSWVLLIAVIAPLAAIVRRASARRADVTVGPGTYVTVALLLFASSGAKASSLPVVAVALAVTALLRLAVDRRIPWGVVIAGLVTGVAQVFSLAVLYRFQTYGLQWGPLQGLEVYWLGVERSAGAQAWVVLGVWVAFVLNMLLRTAGVIPLLADRTTRVDPAVWFLVAGAVAGCAIYLLFRQVAGGNQYFVRSGFTFGVIASGWGYAAVVERAQLSQRAKVAVAVGAGALALLLVRAQFEYAGPPAGPEPFSAVEPILWWALILGGLALVAGVAWRVAGAAVPKLRRRGGVVLLTGILVAGAPGLIMDELKSVQAPNGGAYAVIPLPKSRVDAARWVRDHSGPNDVVATNAHCLGHFGSLCDSRSFWLSAYSERRVLVEGWGFSPRLAVTGLVPFWDEERLLLGDRAITAPTEPVLTELRQRYGVRWLVVDRDVGPESPELASLIPQRYDNGRVAVYELP